VAVFKFLNSAQPSSTAQNEGLNNDGF